MGQNGGQLRQAMEGLWEITERLRDRRGKEKEMDDTRDELKAETYVELIVCVCGQASVCVCVCTQEQTSE